MYVLIIDNIVNKIWDVAPDNLIHNDGSLTLFTNDTPEYIYNLYNIFKVIDTEPPLVNKYQNIITTVEIINGIATQVHTITDVPLETAKLLKYREIVDEWEYNISDGKFETKTVSGFVVDCRRNGVNNDIENINGMIERIEAGRESSPVLWKGYSDTKSLTLEELKNIKLEMLDYGALTYQRKFIACALIEYATSLEELIGIEF